MLSTVAQNATPLTDSVSILDYHGTHRLNSLTATTISIRELPPTDLAGIRAKGLRQEGRPDKDRFLDVCLQPTKLLTPH